MPRRKRPTWWINIPVKSARELARHYVASESEALSALSEASNEIRLTSPSDIDINKLIDLNVERLTNSSEVSGKENPPALHAALRVAYPAGKATAHRAVSAAAWLEVTAHILQAEEAPLAPLVSALEQVPDGATDEQLQNALIKGFIEALKQPQDGRTSYQSVSAALDIWLQHLLDEPSGKSVLGDLDRSKYFGILSLQPAQTVDRASRGTNGWNYVRDGIPHYIDRNNDHTVEYFSADLPLETLWDEVKKLDPRTADAWRLLTAATLEAWRAGQTEPPSIWVDVNELALAMGYRKAKNGGFKPEHLDKVARALVNLERFHITVPLGAKTYPLDPRTGKRKKTKLTASRRSRVIAVFAQDELRDLFGNSYAMRWQVRVGDWIRDYPPRTYAPLYRALVELPVKAGVPLWAKNLGTELCFQYRQDRNRTLRKVLTVETLLTRACLIDQARESKDRHRSRTYFEGALDALMEIGVCTTWQYESNGVDALDDLSASQKGWFEKWLALRVVVGAPPSVVESLPS